MYVLLCITFFILAKEAESYPYGAPACVSSPRHGVEPQKDELDIKILKDTTIDGDVVVQLGSEDSEATFKGFLVKTKAPGNLEVKYKRYMEM